MSNVFIFSRLDNKSYCFSMSFNTMRRILMLLFLPSETVYSIGMPTHAHTLLHEKFGLLNEPIFRSSILAELFGTLLVTPPS